MLILTQLGFNVSSRKGHDTGSLKDLLGVTAQAILEVRVWSFMLERDRHF